MAIAVTGHGMNARVEFKSSSFPKYENEDSETINANLWGKRLAEYLRDHLPRHGVTTAGILCEDFGWIVEIEHDEFPVFIGCGVVDGEADYDDENDGDTDSELRRSEPAAADGPVPLTDFAIFVAAEPGFFKKLFKKVDTQLVLSKLTAALKQLIAESEKFHDVVWDE